MRRDAVNRAALAALALAACGLPVQAQLAGPNADWKEAEVQPPPLKVEGLLPIDMQGSLLRWGVDPSSISIASDGVVRYVVVARNEGGALNAMYEGLRCSTGEVKLYARHAGDQWTPVRDADWKPIGTSPATMHSRTIARNGACVGHGANRSAEQIARDLRQPHDQKFRSEYR